jgi:hypothetical protein
MAKKKIEFYLHGSKDSNYETALDNDYGLSDEALRTFVYTGSEVKFNCELDTETGEVYAYAVEGTPLEKPVRI